MATIDLLFPAVLVKLLIRHFDIALFFQMLFTTAAVLSRRASPNNVSLWETLVCGQ